MKRVLLGCTFAAALAAAGWLSLTPAARADDQADRALEQMAEYYRGLDSMAVIASLDVSQEFQGQSMSIQAEFDFAAERPNRFAMIPRADGRARGGTVVSDGESLHMHVEEVGRHTTEPAPESLDELMDNPLVGMLSSNIGELVGSLMTSDPLARLTDGAEKQYIGVERLDGADHHRVRVARPEMSADFWIAAGDQPLLRKIKPDLSEQVAQARAAGQDISIDMTIELNDWQANPDFDEDRFAFAPPAGSQEVASFFEQPGQADHPNLGRPAPDFTLDLLAGGERRLAEHRGQDVVILDFWATWCGPCVRTMPIMHKVAEKYADRGVVLYAVNLQEDEPTIQPFLDQHELGGLNVLLDRDGGVGQAYNANAIPQAVVIGKDGRVQAVHIGATPDLEQELETEIDALLAGEDLIDE